MPPDDQRSPMPWYEPEMDTVLKITWGMAILGWSMALLGIVGGIAGLAEPVSRAAEAIGLGQMLGWWNDVGEVIVTIGAIIGVLMTTGSLLLGSGRKQVDRMDRRLVSVHGAVLDNGRTLTSVDGKLDKLEQLEKLDQLDDLDVVQAGLDAQTGVLGVQLGVLEQIRDRL